MAVLMKAGNVFVWPNITFFIFGLCNTPQLVMRCCISFLQSKTMHFVNKMYRFFFLALKTRYRKLVDIWRNHNAKTRSRQMALPLKWLQPILCSPINFNEVTLCLVKLVWHTHYSTHQTQLTEKGQWQFQKIDTICSFPLSREMRN